MWQSKGSGYNTAGETPEKMDGRSGGEKEGELAGEEGR